LPSKWLIYAYPINFGQLREEPFRKNWDSELWKLDELSFKEAELRVKNGEDIKTAPPNTEGQLVLQ
jgi:hypothetical protein